MAIKASLDSIERVGAKLSAQDFKEFLKVVTEALPSGTEEYEFLSSLSVGKLSDTEFVKKMFSLLGEQPKIDESSPHGFSWELLSPSEQANTIFKKMEELDPESAHDLYEFMAYVYLNYKSTVEADERSPGLEEEPAKEAPVDAPPFEQDDFAGLQSSAAIKVVSCRTLEALETASPGITQASGLTEEDILAYVKEGGPVVVFSTETAQAVWHRTVGFVDSNDNDLSPEDLTELFGQQISSQIILSVPSPDVVAIMSASGSDLDKLLLLFQRIIAGQVSDEGMASLGFDMQSAEANDVEKIIPTMSVRLGIKLLVEDIMKVLGELGFKSLAELVQSYMSNRAQAPAMDPMMSAQLDPDFSGENLRNVLYTLSKLKPGLVVRAVGRGGLSREQASGGRRTGKATVVKVNRSEVDPKKSRVLVKWASDQVQEELPIMNISIITSSKGLTEGADLVLLSSFKAVGGNTSFVVTGFTRDKNAYSQIYCGKMSLPDAEFKKLNIKAATRPFSGKDLPILAKKFARVDATLVASRHPRITRTFVSQKAALLLRSSAYGMYAVRVPVVYSKDASSYTLFKKIGSSYVSDSGNRFKAVMAAKYGKPTYLLVAAAAPGFFATKGAITCSAYGAIDRTALISQRRAVKRSVETQRQAVLSALADKEVVQAAADKAAADLLASTGQVERQTKVIESLNAQILSTRKSSLSSSEPAPDAEAAIKSGRRVSKLASMMANL